MLAITLCALAVVLAHNTFEGYKFHNRSACLIGEPGKSILRFETYGADVNGWDNGGVTYYFIPSYLKLDRIDYDKSTIKLYDPAGGLIEHPVIGSVQEVLVDVGDGNKSTYHVAFLQSDNIYTVDISISGTDIEHVGQDEYVSISADIISPDGGVICNDERAMIKGRGNTTWDEQIKRPYEIKFSKNIILKDFPRSDKLVLLANTHDRTKLCNKLAFDTASAIGMEYAISSEWADVYIDGVYWGNYLLCHEPDIRETGFYTGNLQAENKYYFRNPQIFETQTEIGYDYETTSLDVSGGYLFAVEQDIGAEGKRNCGFYLDSGNPINIKNPDNASRNEIEYISGFVREIDRQIKDNAEGATEISDHIDMFSFARRYLIDEVFLNVDSQFSSAYYYKRRGDDRLYSGPCWDFDRTCLNVQDISKAYDSVLHVNDRRLEWDALMLNNESIKRYVAKTFEKNTKLFNDILEKEIDDYYNKIYLSVGMDSIRWDDFRPMELQTGTEYGHYYKPESNVRYLKYILYRRMKLVAGFFDVDYSFTEPSIIDGTDHLVKFENDGDLNDNAVFSVPDGDSLSEEELSYYTGGSPDDWENEKTFEKPYKDLPVLEDTVFCRKAAVSTPDTDLQ